MPAGRLMNVLTTGRRREMNTAAWPMLATKPALARAPPNSMVTSLGTGMQADSSTIRTNTASRPYCRIMSVIRCSTCAPRLDPVVAGGRTLPDSPAPVALAEEVGGGQALGVPLGRRAVARLLHRHRDRPRGVQRQLGGPAVARGGQAGPVGVEA